MGATAILRETELALMNAPFEPDGWSRAIGMVARATGGHSAHLAGIGGPLLLPLNKFVGRESDRAAAYIALPELWGPCNWRVQSAGAPMTIQFERHYAVARSVGGTADYDDAVSDLDMPYGCQGILISDERNFLGLAVARGWREGPSDEVCLGRFEHLLRHAQRALRVQLALDGEAAELMLGGLASIHCRMILLDRHGCLCAMTEAAEELVDDGGPAWLSGLSLSFRDPDDERQVQRAMASLLAGSDEEGGPLVHDMRVGRSPDYPAGRWRLSLVRLPQRDHGLGFEPQLALTFRPLPALMQDLGNGAGQPMQGVPALR